MQFRAEGYLSYGPGERAVVWVQQSLADYYLKLIPKCKNVQRQMYHAHITVVRTGLEEKKVSESIYWKKYDGEKIIFQYDNSIQFDGTYYYLNVTSDRIAKIRSELGLPKYRFDDNKKYHITLGNVKPKPDPN